MAPVMVIGAANAVHAMVIAVVHADLAMEKAVPNVVPATVEGNPCWHA